MTDGGWQMADGRWQRADGGYFRAELNKKFFENSPTL